MDARRRGASRAADRAGAHRIAPRAATLAALAVLAGCAHQRPGRNEAISADQLGRRREASRVAQAAADAGDWTAARAALQTLVAEAPRSAEAHQRLGAALANEGQLETAEAAYRRALELDPEYPSALVGLAEVETRLGRLQAALGHLDEAIELDPRRPEAHLARARTLEALGRGDDAVAAYFRALQYDPNSRAALVRVAALQIDRDHPEQALLRLAQVFEVDPDDPDARHQRGRARARLGDAPGAVEDLQLAADKQPDRPDIQYDLALALTATQPPRLEDAARAAGRAAALAPAWAEARALRERLAR
jgi:tetratricopeptide (TPR) repeat protein